ncbi:E3 ubiquitin protein ligase [Salinisphaera sp. G21_0]|nr:E3 ubiquitin protein ligase [Salinisphaera sp. G21_0]
MNSANGLKCAICYDSICYDSTKDKSIKLTCGHIFGKSCMRKWVESTNQRKCLFCNNQLTDNEIKEIKNIPLQERVIIILEKPIILIGRAILDYVPGFAAGAAFFGAIVGASAGAVAGASAGVVVITATTALITAGAAAGAVAAIAEVDRGVGTAVGAAVGIGGFDVAAAAGVVAPAAVGFLGATIGGGSGLWAGL